jgi:hypothetical protein
MWLHLKYMEYECHCHFEENKCPYDPFNERTHIYMDVDIKC